MQKPGPHTTRAFIYETAPTCNPPNATQQVRLRLCGFALRAADRKKTPFANRVEAKAYAPYFDPVFL